MVLWFDLCALPYFLCPFPGPRRAGVPDRLVPVDFDCASRRRAVSRGSAHPRLERWGRSRKRALFLLGQTFRSERRAGVGNERCSSLARPSCRRLDRPSGLSFKYLGQPRSCASFATLSTGASLLLGSWSMRDRGFMNPTGAPEPPGDSGRIIWGIFVLTAGACERTRWCSPRAPG